MASGDSRHYTGLWPPNPTLQGSVTGLPSSPAVHWPLKSGQAGPPASYRTPPPRGATCGHAPHNPRHLLFLQLLFVSSFCVQQPQATSGAGGLLRGSLCPAPLGKGRGQASGLAPSLHPVRDPVSSCPLGDPGSLGVARGLPPAGLRGAALWVSPALTPPSAAAYLCPDSVLVAEDGAVLFRPPPANGGYGRAWLTLGCVPTSTTNLRGGNESSAGLGFLS